MTLSTRRTSIRPAQVPSSEHFPSVSQDIGSPGKYSLLILHTHVHTPTYMGVCGVGERQGEREREADRETEKVTKAKIAEPAQ